MLWKMLSITRNGDGIFVKNIVYEYSDEQTKLIYADIASKISQKYGNIIKHDEILERLNKSGKIYYSNMTEKCNGVFYPSTGDIHTNIYCNNNKVERLMMHEMIHKIQQSKPNEHEDEFYNIFGIVEGATESMAADFFSEGKVNFSEPLNSGMIYKFHSDTKYTSRVAMVRQMSNILENEELLYRFTLNWDMAFVEEFKEKYGEDLFYRLSSAINAMKSKKAIDIQKQELNEAQDILLTEVFDKEFESVKDEESSINYLRKLKKFKSVRTEIDGDKIYED